MQINGFDVHFSYRDDEVWITFDTHSGTLKELIDFRKSFDYECYRFGKGYFNAAKWKTIIADDKAHQSYPREVTLCNSEGKIDISWSDLEALLTEAREFAAQN